LICAALSGLKHFFFLTQGIALGWYIVALSGLRKKISEFFGNTPNLKCFFHLIHLFQRHPGSKIRINYASPICWMRPGKD